MIAHLGAISLGLLSSILAPPLPEEKELGNILLNLADLSYISHTQKGAYRGCCSLSSAGHIGLVCYIFSDGLYWFPSFKMASPWNFIIFLCLLINIMSLGLAALYHMEIVICEGRCYV